jgi:two-component system, response regulator
MLHVDVKKQFGLAIKNWRAKSDISQEELAWRAGLHRSYVADIERGVRNASLQSIEKLAKALKVSLSALFRPLGDQPNAGGASTEGDEPVDILLVEDDRNDVELTLRAFQEARVKNRIHVVSDGAKALEYLFGAGYPARRRSQNRPQLILLDLKLPKVDGMEVLRRIKGDTRTRTIPVIILTASQKSQEILESKRLGAEFYIVKPVDFHRFCDLTPRLSCYWRLFR